MRDSVGPAWPLGGCDGAADCSARAGATGAGDAWRDVDLGLGVVASAVEEVGHGTRELHSNGQLCVEKGGRTKGAKGPKDKRGEAVAKDVIYREISI